MKNWPLSNISTTTLFAHRTAIPDFDSRLRQLVLDCSQLDWSRISPAIFGAMFEGVLEVHEPDLSRQAGRRELGAHYTSERNILRAINPLFMDGLRAELQAAGNNPTRLEGPQYDKLPTLRIMDPACGYCSSSSPTANCACSKTN